MEVREQLPEACSLLPSFHRVGPCAWPQSPLPTEPCRRLCFNPNMALLYSRTPSNGHVVLKPPSLWQFVTEGSRKAVPRAALPVGSSVRIPQTPLPSPPTASHPLLRVQEDLGIEELVAVTVLALPIGHQFAEAGGIANEAWGGSRDGETLSFRPLSWPPPTALPISPFSSDCGEAGGKLAKAPRRAFPRPTEPAERHPLSARPLESRFGRLLGSPFIGSSEQLASEKKRG